MCDEYDGCFFFFKQKTACEMRISDWSSDVCSSDLWLILRAVTGFCTAGTSMIIESWLNERSTNESRGAIFSFYISITLFGVVGGQMVVPFADISTPVLFMICGIFYCLAIIPTAVSRAASPQPLRSDEHTSELQSQM